MGTFRVGAKIENIANRGKSAMVEKLPIDTGSDYTWLPARTLEKIGVKREKKDVTMTMANGQQITRSVGFVIIRTEKFFTVDEVVFAEPDDLLLLGARTLEGFNARVDSKQKKLVAAGPVLAASGESGKRWHPPFGREERMEFECDDGKAAVNLRKHGVSFEEAKTIIENPLRIQNRYAKSNP